MRFAFMALLVSTSVHLLHREDSFPVLFSPKKKNSFKKAPFLFFRNKDKELEGNKILQQEFSTTTTFSQDNIVILLAVGNPRTGNSRVIAHHGPPNTDKDGGGAFFFHIIKFLRAEGETPVKIKKY